MALVKWETANANAYYDEADADAYFDTRLDKAEWTAAVTADRESSLIMAASILDRETYEGVFAGTVLDWGRTGVTDKYGIAVASTVLPPDFDKANFELALALLKDNTVQDQTDSGSNIKKLEAGSATIEYFHSTDGKHALPDVVLKYMAPYLAGSNDVNLSYSYGTDEVSGISTYPRTKGFA